MSLIADALKRAQEAERLRKAQRARRFLLFPLPKLSGRKPKTTRFKKFKDVQYQFILRLNDLSLQKYESLLTINSLSQSSSLYELRETARNALNKVLSINKQILKLDNKCSIVDIGDYYDYFKDITKVESVVINRFIRLLGKIGMKEIMEINRILKINSIEVYFFFTDIRMYIGGRNRNEVKLRIIEAIKYNELELVNYLVDTVYLTPSETELIKRYVNFLKNNDIEGAQTFLQTPECRSLFSDEEIILLRNIIQGKGRRSILPQLTRRQFIRTAVTGILIASSAGIFATTYFLVKGHKAMLQGTGYKIEAFPDEKKIKFEIKYIIKDQRRIYAKYRVQIIVRLITTGENKEHLATSGYIISAKYVDRVNEEITDISEYELGYFPPSIYDIAINAYPIVNNKELEKKIEAVWKGIRIEY